MTHIHDDASGGGDIWKIDLEQGTRTKLTTHPAHDENPVVSPDGAAIAWRSNRTGTSQILRKPSSGTGDEQIWIDMDGASGPTHWSRNWLVFNVDGKSGTQDIWIAPVDGKSPPRPYLETEFNEAAGRLSPDERWMAYQSNVSDQTHIYVSPFPNAREGRWPVSGRDGGGGPAWREDGGEIFTERSGRSER